MDAFADAYCERPDAAIRERAGHIRLLALDVDGVLTDGGVYMGDTGESFKRFHIHDGKGLAMLRAEDVAVAIITARRSEAVTRRAQELGIHYVYQGVGDKAERLRCLTEELALELESVAYVGDEVVDLGAFSRAGLAVAVANAHPRVRRRAHWVTARSGGHGAVREVSELILASQGRLAAQLQRHA